MVASTQSTQVCLAFYSYLAVHQVTHPGYEVTHVFPLQPQCDDIVDGRLDTVHCARPFIKSLD